MLINGEEKALGCPTALSELLTQLGYRAELVAVALVRTFHLVLEQRDVELRFVQQIRAERWVK